MGVVIVVEMICWCDELLVDMLCEVDYMEVELMIFCEVSVLM